MARTYISETIFSHKDKEITVQKSETGHYTVTCKAKGGWKIVKTNLQKRKAASFILKCCQRKKRTELALPIKRVKVSNLLLEGYMKMNGIDWITIRMLNGARPIILKAPRLFRQRLIYIEPEEGQENRFNLRIVDPLTTHRTEPQIIRREVAEEAIKTFGSNNNDNYGEIKEGRG